MKSNTTTVQLLLDVGRVIKQRMERSLPLPYAQCEALRLLSNHKGATMRTIANHFKITAPSATALINELVRAGYVVRSENIQDRREVHLALTPLGKKTERTIAEKRRTVVASVLDVLSDTERAHLDSIFTKILQTVAQH